MVRPHGRLKDALHACDYASCFPKIGSDFRADAAIPNGAWRLVRQANVFVCLLPREPFYTPCQLAGRPHAQLPKGSV